MMTLGTAEQVALYIFLVFVAVFAITTVALLAGLVFGLNKLNEKLDDTIDAVRPLIAKSADVLETVEKVTVNVGERADAILSHAEETAVSVARTVDRTSSVVEQAVTGPLIGAASVFAGVSRGLRAFNHRSRNGNANNHSDVNSKNGHKQS
jgi:hypothetical protein